MILAVDIWAAGVILLCFLSGRYPFFNASNDVDSLLEITQIVGRNSMAQFAATYSKYNDIIITMIINAFKQIVPFSPIFLFVLIPNHGIVFVNNLTLNAHTSLYQKR
jgi:serine/threonine protein kinase